MQARLARIFGLFLLPLLAVCQTSTPQMVRFHTNLGDIDVVLLSNAAPNTVANFLNYMNKGAYDNSVIHRSVPGFVFQGGGYQLQNHSLVPIPADAPINNEFSVSNSQYTLAMALTGSATTTDVNSATTQWYFNETNNAASLDVGFYTVFGRVNLGDTSSIATMNQIAAVRVPNPSPLQSPFDTIPLLNWTSGAPQDSNYVMVLSIRALNPYPAIASQGIKTASDFGGYPAAAAGSFIEIYGTNLAGTTRVWAPSDFDKGDAPKSLDGVSVTIGGVAAYVNYVSPNQVNVQVPAGVNQSGTSPLIVTYNNEVSAAAQLALRPYEGGLLAPASFKVGDTQYVAAIHSVGGAFVTNGKVPGLPNAPAVPGETLVFYGVGFGTVSPGSTPIAGKLVTEPTSLNNSLKFQIGGATALVKYAGLVQGLVGLYQFNVVVPSGLANGDQSLTVQVGQQTVPQTLVLPVQTP